MPAYPFRKMTNRQLKKLLQDEQNQDRSLNKVPAHQEEATQHFPPLQNQPIPASQQSESLNQ